RICAVSGIAAVVDPARWKCKRNFKRVETASTLERNLIAAAHSGFLSSEPRNLPRESHGRSKIVPVVVVDSLSRIRGIRPDELKSRFPGARSWQHPAGKIAAGNAKGLAASAHGSHGQSTCGEGDPVPFITYAEIQRQIPSNLIVVFKKRTEFALFDRVGDERTVSIVRERTRLRIG